MSVILSTASERDDNGPALLLGMKGKPSATAQRHPTTAPGEASFLALVRALALNRRSRRGVSAPHAIPPSPPGALRRQGPLPLFHRVSTRKSVCSAVCRLRPARRPATGGAFACGT